MMDPYDDPYFQPPADIRGAEARAYEEKIVTMLREAMLPDADRVIRLQAIELRGERPDTEIVFRYTDTRQPGRTLAKRTLLWRDRYRWPYEENPAANDRLNDAASVAGWICSAWHAGELEAVDVDEQR